MKKLYEKIIKSNVIIWGVGILQTDLEGIYSFPNIIYYVDDNLKNKNVISVPEDKIFSSEKLWTEKLENVFIIICTEDQNEVIAKLETMGYHKENYVLGEELLINYECYERIHDRPIWIWGTGNTYSFYKNEIEEYLPHVKKFIVSEKKQELFMGKEIYSLDMLEKKEEDTYIVVTSIYYKEIYETLIEKGLRPGTDFMHIYTLIAMGNLSTRIHAEYQFDDRRKKSKDLLVILAGYKEFVWESVFQRIKGYVPEEIDVCVVTSGLVSSQLKDMCRKYQWSYMSTKRNHVSLVVNLAIWLHPEAEFIYKIDEDIFVTRGIFETMKTTYLQVERDSDYEVGFVTPLIPVNGYGYVRILEIFGAEKSWEELFGEIKYTDCYCHHKAIHDNPKAAEFMWGGDNGQLPDLDFMADYLRNQVFKYSICPIRYSIGCILFHRNNWIRMGMFPVLEHSNMGADEEYLCKYCLMQARTMVVAENAVAGHLSYGPQHKVMERYYKEHREQFLLPQGEQNLCKD